jgi:RNA polymerase sigma factor (sigma-70 family)
MTILRSDRRSDADLLRRARAGDAEAFGVFFLRRHALLLAYVASRVGEPDVAADLIAEAFAAALIATHDHERPIPDAPVPWLLGIARHKIADSYRRGHAEAVARQRLAMEPLLLDDDDLSRLTEIAAAVDVVAEIRRIVPPDQLQAVLDRYGNEKPYGDMARELRCSESVVRKRVSRAVATLRTQLGDTR